jgi:hypothetical protein
MTKRPKGKLFALLAVFVAIGLVTASGAFTSVEAERTVSVSTTGDGSALLKLDVSNTNLASITDDQLEIDIGSINLNAQSDLGVVFTIENNGNDDLSSVWIADQNSEAPDDFSLATSGNPDIVEYSNGSGTSIEGSTNGEPLDIGNSMDVQLTIDTTGITSTGDLSVGNIVIVAEE